MFVDSKLVLPGQCKIALSANVLPCKAHTSYLIHLNVSVPGSINPFVRSFTAQKVNNPLVFARVVVKTHHRRSIFFFYRPADHESPTQSHAIFDHRPSGTRQTARTTLASRIESGIGRFTKKGKNLIQRTLVHTTPDRNRRTKIQFCLLLFHCVWLFFIRLSASDGPSSPQSSSQSSSAPPPPSSSRRGSSSCAMPANHPHCSFSDPIFLDDVHHNRQSGNRDTKSVPIGVSEKKTSFCQKMASTHLKIRRP